MSSPIVKRRKPPGQLRCQPSKPTAECARCHQTAPVAARRLCDACYYHVRKDPELLADYPTVRRLYDRDELLVEYELLRSAGNTDEVIAVRLGYRSVRHMLERVALIRRRQS
jgi:hypothetical protein